MSKLSSFAGYAGLTAICVAVFGSPALQDPAGARKTLVEDFHMKPKTVGDNRWRFSTGCSTIWGTPFVAVDATGKEVTGVVCGDLFDNNSVAIDNTPKVPGL